MYSVTRKIFVNKMRETFIVENSHWPMNKERENEMESKFLVCGASRDHFSFSYPLLFFFFQLNIKSCPRPELRLWMGMWLHGVS